MPLETEVLREGKRVDHIWDYATLSALYSICIGEAAPDEVFASDGRTMGEVIKAGQFVDMSMFPIYYLDVDIPLVKTGEQVIENDYTFGEDSERPIIVKKGDVFRAWRTMK
jgi:hypothetical protein